MQLQLVKLVDGIEMRPSRTATMNNINKGLLTATLYRIASSSSTYSIAPSFMQFQPDYTRDAQATASALTPF
ncbi:hypothetical protein RB195_004857 [Necator americanus]|uniref:Uncharacterized protein n=1 Tax=Necator americanus TaxID=51031 RepID=A0ABR1BK11_NECAM